MYESRIELSVKLFNRILTRKNQKFNIDSNIDSILRRLEKKSDDYTLNREIVSVLYELKEKLIKEIALLEFEIRKAIEKPKVVVELSGGLVEQIMATTDMDVEVIDYGDTEEEDHVATIDNRQAYVFWNTCVDVEPDIVNRMHRDIDRHRCCC